ncbi:MAG: hypothetical protein HRU19_01410 [Pseudobacteriovorax sp.]|nr:hypothetical protein [Pseudobacteriovorax sp.]
MLRFLIKWSVAIFFCTNIFVLGLAYYSSELLLFPGNLKHRQKSTECDGFLENQAFQNISGGAANGPNISKSCEDVASSLTPEKVPLPHLNTGHTTHLFDLKTNPDGGIWLHLSGVNGNYLHGARYLDMAKSFGKRLFALEYINHGLSDSDGKGTGWGCKERHDVSAAITYLAQTFPEQTIFITSTSMGSMATALALQDLKGSSSIEQISTVVYESPIPNVEELSKFTSEAPPLPHLFFDLGIWIAGLRSGLDFHNDSCNPKVALKSTVVPAFVISSRLDKVTPTALVRSFVESIPKEKLLGWTEYESGFHSTVYNGQPGKVEDLFFELSQK